MFQPPELPSINPEQAVQDITNVAVNTSTDIGNTAQETGQNINNEANKVMNTIDDVINQLNQLKGELEGKINELENNVKNEVDGIAVKVNEIKGSVENEIKKINLQEVKDKIDLLTGFPAKLSEFQTKITDHWKSSLAKFIIIAFFLFVLFRYLYKALIGFIDWPYNFVARRLWKTYCRHCGKWLIIWNPLDSREICYKCRKIAKEK